MYEIVSWPLLITAALCLTTQGCALPAPSWPVVLNYCSGATRKFFHRIHVLGTQDFTGLEHSLTTAKTLVYLLIWDRQMLFL